MYKEVAFDPQCLEEYHYYGLLKSGFGEEKGRYVIAALNAWVCEAVHYVKNSELKDIKKHSIKNFLNRLKREKGGGIVLLPADRRASLDPKTVSNWEQWYEWQRAYRDFSVTVSERELKGALTYEDIIGDCVSWNISPTVRIERNPDQIIGMLIPIIRLSSSILLIDNYFKLSGNDVLKALLDEIQRFPNIKKLDVVTSIDTKSPDQVFNREYRNNYSYLPKITLVVADDRFFHDRYFITDKAAIKAGHGFTSSMPKGAHSDGLSIGICGEHEKAETESELKNAFERELARSVVLVPEACFTDTCSESAAGST